MTSANQQHLDTIINFLSRQIANGDPAPSFQSQDFADLIAAARNIAEQDRQTTYEAIGRRALELLLCSLSASMQGERTVALMRDNSRPL